MRKHLGLIVGSVIAILAAVIPVVYDWAKEASENYEAVAEFGPFRVPPSDQEPPKLLERLQAISAELERTEEEVRTLNPDDPNDAAGLERLQEVLAKYQARLDAIDIARRDVLSQNRTDLKSFEGITLIRLTNKGEKSLSGIRFQPSAAFIKIAINHPTGLFAYQKSTKEIQIPALENGQSVFITAWSYGQHNHVSFHDVRLYANGKQLDLELRPATGRSGRMSERYSGYAYYSWCGWFFFAIYWIWWAGAKLNLVKSPSDVRIAELEKELTELKPKLESAEKMSVEHTGNISTLDTSLKDATTELGNRQRRLDNADQLDKQRVARILELEEQRTALEADAASLQEKVQNKLQRMAHRISLLEKQLQRANKQIEWVRAYATANLSNPACAHILGNLPRTLPDDPTA